MIARMHALWWQPYLRSSVMSRSYNIYRLLALLVVVVLFVGCSVNEDFAPDHGNDHPTPPNKPLVPIKRRPIGGQDVERPRIDEDRDWDFLIYPPHRMSMPCRITLRSVATGEELSKVLDAEQEYWEVKRKGKNGEYLLIVESDGVIVEEVIVL